MIMTGIFSWPPRERRSDRYGTISITATNYDGSAETFVNVDEARLRSLVGKRTRLVATVVEARESGHVGDLFRGIYPSKPNVGEVIDLGTGTFFIERDGETPCLGLIPDDHRDHDWFDPHKLYRLHDQTVSLEVTPA